MYDWRAEWEKAAKAEAEHYAQLSLETLCRIVRRGSYGRYYALWRAIARRASLEEAGWLLYGGAAQ